MSNQEKASLIERFNELFANFSSFLEIDFSLKLFGVPIFKFHYPPQKS